LASFVVASGAVTRSEVGNGSSAAAVPALRTDDASNRHMLAPRVFLAIKRFPLRCEPRATRGCLVDARRRRRCRPTADADVTDL
jgi:hypothetical protein